MKKAKKQLMKFKIIKEIMDVLFESGSYVDKRIVTELIEYEKEDLIKLLRDVKINGFLDEDTKGD